MMLTADELLAGSSIEHEVELPPGLLARGADAAGERRVRLRPLTVRDLQLISRAAREQDALAGALMVQAALVEPRLDLQQVNRLPAGLLDFLLEQVNRLSGLEVDGDALAEAAQDPLLQAVHRLAHEFGWTLEEISALTMGQILLQLEMLRGDAPDAETHP